MENTVSDVPASAQLAPLRFGGGLIGLAIPFLIPTVVAGIYGTGGIAGRSVETALTALLTGLPVGIIRLPVGGSLGGDSVATVAEADRAEEIPGFLTARSGGGL